MLSNKDLEGFKFKDSIIDDKISDLSHQFYYFEKQHQFELFRLKMRLPTHSMTWIIKNTTKTLFGDILNDLEIVIRQYDDCLKNNRSSREYPHLFIDQNLTDFLGNNDNYIGEKQVTDKFYDVMKSIRMKPGVYFLYNSSKKLTYIGKSKDLGSRIPMSVGERKAHFYDYAITNSASDCGVYEMYFISKYKPKLNKEGKFPDELTIELPELKLNGIAKIFKR